MALEIGILHNSNAWATAVLAHAAAKYDGELRAFSAFNPDTDETEHVQYVDCHMPVVAETRLMSVNLTAPKTPCLAPLLNRLSTLVLLINTEAELGGINQAITVMSRLNTAATPECMVVVNADLIDITEARLNSTLGVAPINDHRIFVMPADPTEPSQTTHLIHRFISAQREAEIALMIDTKTKRMPRFNEAERTLAAHALKDKIMDAAKTVVANRVAEKIATGQMKLLAADASDGTSL
jgi:hypothetical protein